MEMPKNTIALGKDCFISRDTHVTGMNNNVLVNGGSGRGKTRGVVIPNILQAEGSYVISDPKGNLCDTYGPYLEKKGYIVKRLDFACPEKSIHYNPLKYVLTDQDYIKLGHMLATTTSDGRAIVRQDPFWERTSSMLMSSAIGFVKEIMEPESQTMVTVMDFLNLIRPNDRTEDSKVEKMMSLHLKNNRPHVPFSVRQYRKVEYSSETTFRSILITTQSALGALDTDQMREVFRYDETDIAEIGQKKTAFFVVVSDTDRSLDVIANIFFSQALNELCNYADRKCKDQCLPVPVQFIMDDFATNCRIDSFPKMISSFRSRGISTMIIIQAESQLEAAYDTDGRTIIANCDTILYLGGNDMETSRAMSERSNRPLEEILNLPVGKHYVFRNGEEAKLVERINIEELEEYKTAMKLCRNQSIQHMEPDQLEQPPSEVLKHYCFLKRHSDELDEKILK